jgi:hypothetical protein
VTLDCSSVSITDTGCLERICFRLVSSIWIDEKTGKTAPCRVMAVKAYSCTQAKFWCVDFTIISLADRCDLQLPVRRGAVKSVNHAMNLQDLFRQFFNHPSTLEDLGITEERSKQIMSATIDDWRDSLQNPFALACVLSSQINAADARRKEQEQKQLLHARRPSSGRLSKKPEREAPPLAILNRSWRRAGRWIQSLMR